MYFSTGNEAALLVQPRNLVIVGENAHVQIIDVIRFERKSSFNQFSYRDFCSKRAIVDFIKFKTIHLPLAIDNTYVSQQEESSVAVNTFSLVETLRETTSILPFWRKNVSYLGITIIGDKQHVDHYTCACYAKLRKPSGLQRIFSDRSTGVFNGKIL
jgi:Fe-S cluster assembly protein SufD